MGCADQRPPTTGKNMSSLSSLTKNCPHCHQAALAETEFCTCGHHFSADAGAILSSSDLVVKAEELYESHLRARLQRAARTARFAKIDVMRDSRNQQKAQQLRDAEQEVK